MKNQNNQLLIFVILSLILIGIISQINGWLSLISFLIIFLCLYMWFLKGGLEEKKMTEYKCVEVERRIDDTQDKLNRLAKEGWIVITNCAGGNYIIMERGSMW